MQLPRAVRVARGYSEIDGLVILAAGALAQGQWRRKDILDQRFDTAARLSHRY